MVEGGLEQAYVYTHIHTRIDRAHTHTHTHTHTHMYRHACVYHHFFKLVTEAGGRSCS